MTVLLFAIYGMDVRTASRSANQITAFAIVLTGMKLIQDRRTQKMKSVNFPRF